MTDNPIPTGQDPTGQDPTAGAQTGAQGDAKKGRLSDAIRQKYPDLEQLINETESMTVEEREYWFQILPIMTDEQIQKLRGILVHEKEQLAKLDKEYETEISKLNDKHVLEQKEQERQEEREELVQKEAAHEEEEQAAEEELLKQLEDVDETGAVG